MLIANTESTGEHKRMVEDFCLNNGLQKLVPVMDLPAIGINL